MNELLRLVSLKSQLDSIAVELFIQSLPDWIKPLIANNCEVIASQDDITIRVHTDSKEPPLSASEIADNLFECRKSILSSLSDHFLPDSVVIVCKDKPFYTLALRDTELRKMSSTGSNGTTIRVLDSLQLSDIADLDSLINWMRVQTVPLSLTPNDTNVTGYVNQAYANFTDRSQAEWLGDIGNVRRFPEGELGRIIRSLKSAPNQIISDFQFTAEVWNLPGIPYYWFGDAREIILSGRSYRLLHTKHREQKSVLV